MERVTEFSHSFPFDPRCGFDEAALLRVAPPAEVEGFADFWRKTYAQAMKTPLNIACRPIYFPSTDADYFEIEYDGLDGGRVGGWLRVPRQEFSRGVVIGHGYGGREKPDDHLPGAPAAAIFPCARGFHRSAAPGLPGNAAFHVIRGIESRESYIHRYCAADLWSAASVLLELFPQVADRLDYQGASFGGGMGAIALPWDHRFRRAFLDVPSFGNHPLRLTLPCVGSGESVRLLHQRRPEIIFVLRFFDSAVAAAHIHIPTLAACALFDPAVPPPGQFAVYNALAGEKELFVRPAAHFDFADGAKVEEEVYKRLETWFKDDV
jgi:cephalosporin-C deacetylase